MMLILRNIALRLLMLAALLVDSQWADAAKTKYPGGRFYVFRYTLTDKGETPPIERPQRFLSHKSIERRLRQALKVDSTDLPISRAYLNIFETASTHVLGSSRWQQTVLVRGEDSLTLEQLVRLPMVKECRCVYVSPDSISEPEDIRWLAHDKFQRYDSVKNDPYGMGRPQIESLGGVRLHEAGFMGDGITIAIIDGGFRCYDRIPALQQARLLGIRDFAGRLTEKPGKQRKLKRLRKSHKSGYMQFADETPSFQDIDHGTKVYSIMAAQAPEVFIGTAPHASFWLLRSEIPQGEQPIEEDLWTMAAEFADSVGVDIINSSLGYYTYDSPHDGYRHEDLDGRTAFISKSASLLARKGIVLCNSAGNSGHDKWKKIGVPADAHDIITVGAIDADGQVTTFSSIGPTADNRVKPDIVARGRNTAMISGRGTLVHDMGTSFATPVVCGLVACLWQALPQLTALDIIGLVRRCTDHYDTPTDDSGYGKPDFWKAYQVRSEE